ncbi:MAG: FAD-binding oxidoreductase, partial [bacterium]|nr:FAD-binding oxidoreductase [bacterium]
NGGWCVGELAAGPRRHEAVAGNDAARRFLHALHDAVDEVGRVAEREGFDCQYAKGGAVRLARNRAHLTRQREQVEHFHRAYGLTDHDMRMLGADEARTHLAATRVVGGMFFAHTAALHPARLVRGLGSAVESLGGKIVEGTAATAIEPGAVATDRGVVKAEIVVRALEGYTGTLEGNRRTLAPLYSLMVATEPIDDTLWDEIGLSHRQTFTDDRFMVIYGQRTADGRIAFGGRGAPYNFGSRIASSVEQRSRTHERIAETLVELLPMLSDVAFTHRWGGVLGVPRDWFPSVGLDRGRGMAWGGGYVGEGVAAANLAGRTLAELIAEADSPRIDLPWVGHRSRRWAPEPLRWLGINGALRIMGIADRSEAITGRTSRLARMMQRMLS